MLHMTTGTLRNLPLDKYDTQKGKGERFQADVKAYAAVEARGENMRGRKEPEAKDSKYGNCEGPPLREGDALSYFGGSELHITLGWVKRLLDGLEVVLKHLDHLIMAAGGRATTEIIALDAELYLLQLEVERLETQVKVNPVALPHHCALPSAPLPYAIVVAAVMLSDTVRYCCDCCNAF